MATYADIYKQAMKDRAPEMYRQLEASGELAQFAEEARGEALRQIGQAIVETYSNFFKVHRQDEHAVAVQIGKGNREGHETALFTHVEH